MKKDQLESILFSERAFVYAVLDGASIPGLLDKLYQHQPPNVSVMRGELEPDMAEVAPYLVNLKPGGPFTNWVLEECYGKHWGIFAQTINSFIEMRKHFRSLLTVWNEDGNPMIFRYYDPRVLTKFLPTCTEEELATFFGNTTQLFAENVDEGVFVSYKIEAGKLKEKEFEPKKED
jgi:hypothetical protein